ncbi:MAG: bifunctional phosphoribosyl-AMP cyclohydrolase/phosphoribosyl-ATP diphosphatase HisIE [Gemmatimonadota bacterium]
MTIEFDPADVRFDESTGLAPAIVQDAADDAVLMLGYMNAEALRRTLETGRVTFFSRSRERLWRKGETSGNTLRLISVVVDCDGDALLVRAAPEGPTCHTGRRSCFGEPDIPSPAASSNLGEILSYLNEVVEQRDRDRPSGSYTTNLLNAGPLRLAQKVAEEGIEVALAVAADPSRVASESADLLYHLLVLWQVLGLKATEVADELSRRRHAAE